MHSTGYYFVFIAVCLLAIITAWMLLGNFVLLGPGGGSGGGGAVQCEDVSVTYPPSQPFVELDLVNGYLSGEDYNPQNPIHAAQAALCRADALASCTAQQLVAGISLSDALQNNLVLLNNLCNQKCSESNNNPDCGGNLAPVNNFMITPCTSFITQSLDGSTVCRATDGTSIRCDCYLYNKYI